MSIYQAYDDVAHEVARRIEKSSLSLASEARIARYAQNQVNIRFGQHVSSAERRYFKGVVNVFRKLYQ